MSKLLIAHGGGPSPVINASLLGAVLEARESGLPDMILGAIHGSAGILTEQFFDLGALTDEELKELYISPASAIGTSRTPLYEKEYRKMAELLQKNDISWVLFTGGNGSMDTCGHLQEACKDLGITVGGIPKTIDNDIDQIDHAPGYGSAARFAARTMQEIGADVDSMPIHVCIVEYMGRNAGWVTAASALARDRNCHAPDLILLPEIPFEKERFLAAVADVWKKGHGVVVAVSEGLHYADGSSIAEPVFRTERATYPGNVAEVLSKFVISELGIKARTEKPGILGRCCAEMVSSVDREEALHLGRLAAKTVLSGIGGMMPGLRRISSEPYRCEDILIPVQQVMLHERLFPENFYRKDCYDVTDEFIRWARPLIGEIPKGFRSLR